MYKLIEITTLSGTTVKNILRVADDAFIPFDPANKDYQEFLKYKEAGGKVYEADEEVPVNG